jgi:NADH-quinone oxidoreductase subunit G
MPTIHVDGKTYEVEEGQNLLQACLSLGFDLPYFCWHPALHSVGACRQCAVKVFRDEKDRKGSLVMACMTPAAHGTRISIDDPEAREFRASVIEWLMVNHPHDCPVCDEGGECHLQDMTVMTGHAHREFRFRKRTYRNQDLGPFINHEMNRCIQCYRCVRFYRDYAGGRDFNVFAAHDHVYFGRHQDGTLESEFSGNLVEICPTGVFTDKTLKKHYTRKWDLQTAPSVCIHCGLGCNTTPGARYGRLRRIRNRYNGQVNGYFLCDRGRYGYEFVNADSRPRRALRRQESTAGLKLTDGAEALTHLKSSLSRPGSVIGIGSPRASLEANFALRSLVGPARFYLGLSGRDARLLTLVLRILREGLVPAASLAEVQRADAVLRLGEDVTNTAPLLALALRQVRQRQAAEAAAGLHIPAWNDAAVREVGEHLGGLIFVASSTGTKLDDLAKTVYRGSPDEVARLGFAVAMALGAKATPVGAVSPEMERLAGEMASALGDAKRPLIVSGTGSGSEAVLEAAANVAWALAAKGLAARISLAVPECNSLGLSLMSDQALDAAVEEVATGAVETVIVLENDLYRRADAAAVNALLKSTGHLVVLDHLLTETALRAEVVLPVASFAEASGTVVNNESRAQRFYQVFVPEGEIRASWRWLRDMMVAAGRLEPGAWEHLDQLRLAMAEAIPLLRPAIEAAPVPPSFAGTSIPRESHRYSGRTAIHSGVTIHEPEPPADPDSPFAFSMEGYQGELPGALAPRFWAPGWNSIQALNKFQGEVGGPLRGGDPGSRLIEAAPAEGVSYFTRQMPPPAPRDERLIVVPLHHIFGSEELSMLTPAVAERAPRPYLALHPDDANRLSLAEGDEVDLALGETTLPLTVRLILGLARGVAGVPAGLPGLPGLDLPAPGRISRGVAP